MLFSRRTMWARLYRLATALSLRLAGARALRLDLGDVSLRYYRLGREGGEPWLLLHGLGSTTLNWAALLPELRRRARLILPELSAIGGTRAPRAALGIREGTRIAAELVEREFGPRPVTVGGVSLGGWMAVRLALSHPHLVSRLLLVVSAGYRHQDWERILELLTVRTLDDVDRLHRALFARPRWILRLIRRGFLEVYGSPAVQTVLQETQEKDAFDRQDLAQIQVPVGLVWGEKDGLFPVEVARAMAAALPRGRLFVLPHGGHAVQMDCPWALVQAVREFREWAPLPGEETPAPVPS